MTETQICRGTQLGAPNGFDHLQKGTTYIFLASGEVVRLVQFIEQPMRTCGKKRVKQYRPPPEVVILSMDRGRFEWGVQHDQIVVLPKQNSLPPWCEGLGNIETEFRDRYAKKKVEHKDRVDTTLKHMAGLLADVKGVLAAADPIAVVNEAARLCAPPQNQQRFRTAFFAYVAYGENRNVIAYQVHRIGGWNRKGHSGVKCGPKAKGLGALHSFKSEDDQLLADVRKGWDTFAQQGRTLRCLYRLTCAHIWQCRKIKDERGRKRLVRLDGKPFMTYDQFQLRLFQIVGKETIYKTLRGRAWFREEKAPSLGHFSEAVANICERTEADGYWLEEVAIAPDGQSHLPQLIVVRIICVATGMRLGIGFSFGGETGAAYRMALFCMSVPKDYFCSLFGMAIDPMDWPSVGLSDDCVVDRGPGQGRAGKSREFEGLAVINELPPTGFGQGKASVESTHPRKIETRDRPSFVETSIPLLHLVRREIRNTIAWNDAHDISSRLGPRRIAAADRVTPLDLYNKLAAVGRNDSRSIARSTAIRSFLTKLNFDVKADGAYLYFQRYDSPELRSTGLLERVAGNDSFGVCGYVLDMAIRQVWIDVAGELIPAYGQLHLREDDGQLDISITELQMLAAKLDEMKADLRTHREAELSEAEAEFAKDSGFTAANTRRRSGKPRRGTQEARDLAREVKKYVTPGKLAA